MRTAFAKLERRAGGQAMVEFVIAIFAIVVIVAGIIDYIGLAGRHGELAAEVRGKAGKVAIEHLVVDAEMPEPPEMPALETSEAVLARGFAHEKEEEKVELSPAMRKWVFVDSLDAITVRGEAWMPGMRIGDAE